MHLGIIPDGNRRFGKEKSKDGHFEGMKNILKTIVWFASKEQVEIKELTIFCFSEENWKRSEEEVEYLMKLFEMILDEVDHFITYRNLSETAKILISDDFYLYLESDSKVGFCQNPAQLMDVNLAITNPEKFSKEIIDKINSFMNKYNNHPIPEEYKEEDHNFKRRRILNLCVSYTGKSEIVRAVKRLVETNKPVTSENIESELLIKSFPDLVIRSSGEQRLSGFLPWQTCYSEFMFLDKHWPEISINDLKECIELFKKRNRRFGK